MSLYWHHCVVSAWGSQHWVGTLSLIKLWCVQQSCLLPQPFAASLSSEFSSVLLEVLAAYLPEGFFLLSPRKHAAFSLSPCV